MEEHLETLVAFIDLYLVTIGAIVPILGPDSRLDFYGILKWQPCTHDRYGSSIGTNCIARALNVASIS